MTKENVIGQCGSEFSDWMTNSCKKSKHNTYEGKHIIDEGNHSVDEGKHIIDEG